MRSVYLSAWIYLKCISEAKRSGYQYPGSAAGPGYQEAAEKPRGGSAALGIYIHICDFSACLLSFSIIHITAFLAAFYSKLKYQKYDPPLPSPCSTNSLKQLDCQLGLISALDFSSQPKYNVGGASQRRTASTVSPRADRVSRPSHIGSSPARQVSQR